MSKDDEESGKAKASRRQRLAAELRRNLQRRKAQARARRNGAEDESEGQPGAPPPREPDR